MTIAEVAHIIAASDEGPRPDPDVSDRDRAAYDNLILLCSSCHTLIDKDEASFPDGAIREWKASHRETVHRAIETPRFEAREDARGAIETLLAENRHVWKEYGPHGENAEDPESEKAAAWERECVGRIIPNNQRMIAILEANEHLLTPDEVQALAKLRVHATGFALRHLTTDVVSEVTRFPSEIEEVLR